MGEQEKKIGEFGEAKVRDFLHAIGWEPLAHGFDIECEFPELHKLPSSKGPRQKHGIDFGFSYICPMVSECRRNLLISVKNSCEEVTKTRTALLKSDLTDLSTALKCFKRSPERALMIQEGGATRSEELGLLLRINLDQDESRSYLGNDLTANSIEVPTGDPIYLVENQRFDFVARVIKRLSEVAESRQHSYVVPKTSLSVGADMRRTSSTVLPVQSLVGGPIAVQVSEKGDCTPESSLMLFVDQPFKIDNFRRLASLGFELSSNWVEVRIAFNDYNELKHGSMVRQVLAGMAQKDFANRVIPISSDLRLRFQ